MIINVPSLELSLKMFANIAATDAGLTDCIVRITNFMEFNRI